MTPARSDQPDQRIWPTGSPERPAARAPLARKLTAPIRRLHAALINLTTNPASVTTPDGVTYQPRARTSLAEALADTGPGHLDFGVTFPDLPNAPRKRITIRATRDRVFHDLTPDDHTFHTLAHAAIAVTRPGDRVLLIGAGTGALTAIIADHAGPSGAITAFEADAQSVAFARARYPLPNAAHERLSRTTLPAEPPAAAETIILTPRAAVAFLPADPTELLARLARPGRLLLTGPHAPLADAFRALPGLTVEPLMLSRPPNRTTDSTDSPLVVVRKPPAA